MNNKLLFIFSAMMAIGLCFSCSLPKSGEQAQITARALEEFQNMKYGMFIHFGLYAVPSGVWKNDTLKVGEIAEHIMRIKRIPREEYRQLAKHFNPSAFDPEEYVSLAKQAGMQYIVITAKHHDGFAMFHSSYDSYNIKDGTPYEKDLIKALSEECKKQGIKLGFYYSHTRDWDEYHSVCVHGNHWDWDRNDPGRDQQLYLDTKVKLQLTELLTNYGEVFCIWFDTPYTITPEQAEELYSLVKGLQPGCLINSRLGAGWGDYGVMGDNQVPPGVVQGYWECPATMNHSWGFHQADKTWKSSEHMLTQLVDLSSKNVNYLLNIGPKADGSIPEESKTRLMEIGHWISTNGEAVYRTDPSPWFQEIDGLRISSKDNILYITLVNTRPEEINLYNLNNEILKVECLHSGIPLSFEQKRLEIPKVSVLTIQLPRTIKDETLPVLKVTLTGKPVVTELPTQMSSGNVLLHTGISKIITKGGELSISGIDGTIDVGEWPYFATENWKNPNDYLEWDFHLIELGIFRVKVINVSTTRQKQRHLEQWNNIFRKPDDYHKVSFSVNGQKITGPVKGQNAVENIRSVYRPEFANDIGSISLDHPGTFRAKLEADFINPEDPDGLVVYEVRLEKIHQ